MTESSARDTDPESSNSESLTEDESFIEKSYNGLFTKSQAVDMFLFIQFMPNWLTFVAISIFMMFTIETYKIMFATPVTSMGYLPLNVIYTINICIQLLDFTFIVVHKIMKRSAKRRYNETIPTVFIILDFIALMMIISPFLPININLPIYGIVFRFYRVYNYLYYSTVSDYELKFLRSMIRFTIEILYILQIFICIWKYIHSDPGDENVQDFGSLTKSYYNLTWKENKNYDFLLCMFYTTGAFTRVGYGFVQHKKWLEHLFISIIGLAAIILITTFIAVNTITLVERYRRQCTFWFKLNLVLKYMNNRYISRRLKQKVLQSYELFWLKERGQNSSYLFEELPTVLRNNVKLDMYWYSLTKAHIFEDSNLIFLRSIANVMKTTIYEKNDVIYNQGDLIMSYSYVAWGSIRILSPEDTETTLLTLGMGSCLGGFSLMYSYNINVEVVANSYCVIHTIDKKDFWRADLWKSRLVDTNKFKKFVENRIQYVKYKHPQDSANYPIDQLKKTLISESQNDLFSHASDFGGLHFGNCTLTDIYVLSKVHDDQSGDEIFFSSNFPWKFNPQSQFLYVWNMIVIGTIAVSFPIFAYEAGLKWILFYTEVLNPLVTVIYISDVVIQSMTVIENVEGVHSKISSIFVMRCTSIFFLTDIVAALPILNVAQAFADIQGLLYIYLYMNKLIKMIRVFMILMRFENDFRLNVLMIKLLKYLVLLPIFIFIFGTALIGIHKIWNTKYNNTFSWKLMLQRRNRANSDLDTALFMYYYILTNLTLITHIPFSGNVELVFLIILSFIGTILFIYLVSDFSAVFILLTELREVDGNYLTICDKFLQIKGLKPDTRIRVTAFLAAKYEFCKMGLNRILLNEISEDLYAKVHLARYLPLSVNLPLFENVPREIVKKIVINSKVHYFPPKEFLVYAGDYISYIFIIESGYCKVTCQRTGMTKKILGPNDHFGIIETFLEQPLIFDIQAYTNVIILIIELEDIKGLYLTYPRFQNDLNIVRSHFTELLLERVFINTYQNKYKHIFTSKVKSWIIFDNTEDVLKMKRYKQEFTGFSSTIGKYLMRRTLIPDGDFLVKWEFVYNIAAVIGAMVIPGRVFVSSMHVGIEAPLYITLYSIYLTTMYLRFHVCYYNENQILVSHPIFTAKHYLKGSFVIDLLALLPISEIIYCLNERNTAALNQICGLSKLLLLYRFPEIHFRKDMLRRHNIIFDLLYFISLAAILVSNSGYLLHFIILKIGVKDLYINDYLKGYGLLDLAIKVDNPLNVYSLYSLPNKKFIIQSQWYLYLYSMYWSSMLIMGNGIGLIIFDHNVYYLFNTLTIVIGYFFNIWMIAKLCSRQSQINKECIDFQESVQELMSMMTREKISLSLKKQIFSHFEYLFMKSNGLSTSNILTQCSIPLQQSLSRAMYNQTLFMVPVFNGMPNAFWRAIAILCSERHYLVDVPIIIVNDVVDSMYIVHSGTIKIQTADGTVLESLGKGSLFGNLDQIKSGRSMINAIPSKKSDILLIQTSKFYEAIKRYPIVENRILKHISTKSLFYIVCLEDVNTHVRNREKVRKGNSCIMFLGTNNFKTICMYICLVTYFLTMYIISFVPNTNPLSGYVYIKNTRQSFAIIFYALESINLVITLLGFYTPIYINGDLITNYKIVANMYVNSAAFIINVIALIPIYEISWLFAADVYYTRYLLLNRAVRVCCVYIYLSAMQKRLNVNVMITTITSSIVYITTILHTMVCFTYWITIFNESTYSWTSSEVCGDLYVCTIYYVTSAITGIGFVTIRPSSPMDIVVFIILVFSGRFVLAILVGNICCAVRHMKYGFFKFVNGRREMLLYLCDKISKPLLKQLIIYYDQLWGLKRAHQFPVLLLNAPSTLVGALFMEAFGHHIYNNPVFMHCHPDFQRLLIRTMQMETFFPGDIIMKQGSLDNKMFFIHRGLVEVFHEEGIEDAIVDILEENDSFGVLELLFPCQQHSHTFKALLITEIIYITGIDLQNLLQFYPASKHNIYEIFTEVDINPGAQKFKIYT